MINNTGAPLFVVVPPGSPTTVQFANGTTLPSLATTWIPDPPADLNADTDALSQINNPVMLWAPTASRKFDPRTAPNSMLFWMVKDITGNVFSITIDVTTGGNAGWTTPGGLNTNFVLTGSGIDPSTIYMWLVRIDLPRKTVIVQAVKSS